MNEAQIREWALANKRANPPLAYVRPGSWFKMQGVYHLYWDCIALLAVEDRDPKWARGIVSASEASSRNLLCCRSCERRRMEERTNPS